MQAQRVAKNACKAHAKNVRKLIDKTRQGMECEWLCSVLPSLACLRDCDSPGLRTIRLLEGTPLV